MNRFFTALRKRLVPVAILSAGVIGYLAGHATQEVQPEVLHGHFDDISMLPQAMAQQPTSGETMPFGYNRPGLQQLAPDAPPATYWNIDDIKKAHTELAEKASKALTQAGSGSTQAFGSSAVRLRTRNFTMSMLYRAHREQS